MVALRGPGTHEDVLALDVPVENVVVMEVAEALQDLSRVAPHDGLTELAVFGEHRRDAVTVGRRREGQEYGARWAGMSRRRAHHHHQG